MPGLNVGEQVCDDEHPRPANLAPTQTARRGEFADGHGMRVEDLGGAGDVGGEFSHGSPILIAVFQQSRATVAASLSIAPHMFS